MAQESERADLLLKQFEATAFNSEFGRKRNFFDRWQGVPVRIRLLNGDDQRHLVHAVVDELSNLSQLDIQIVNNGSANVLITFGDFDGCRATVDDPTKPARIKISTRYPILCLREEIYQILALPGDACIVRSILCDDLSIDEFTDADRILMKVAYDPRLKIRMTRGEAMPIARIIIRELLAAE